MEFQPRLYTIFYRSWARKMEEFRNRYFVSSHPHSMCVEYVSLPSKGQEPKPRRRRADRKIHYLIRVLQSDPAKVTPTRIVLRLDNPSPVSSNEASLPEASHGSSHREEPDTEDRTEMQCYIRSNWGDLRTRPRYVIQILKFHTRTYTRIRSYKQNTRLRDKEKSINIYKYI